MLLCTGKVYYDIMAEAAKRAERPAVVRLEQLYSIPEMELQHTFEQYPGLKELVWVQEEPRNMGAWYYLEDRLKAILPAGATLRYMGRPERASPAEGYPAAHLAEQKRIVMEALG
jgi:2-oxoglutarate dehydrogenase complex dehydrogenase (E1) component-like enzyme